jgi:hypothetical protein
VEPTSARINALLQDATHQYNEERTRQLAELDRRHYAPERYRRKLQLLIPENEHELGEKASVAAKRLCEAAKFVKQQYGDFWLRHRLAQTNQQIAACRSAPNADERQETPPRVLTKGVVLCLLEACDNHASEVEGCLRALSQSPIWAVDETFREFANYLMEKHSKTPPIPRLRNKWACLAKLMGAADESTVRKRCSPKSRRRITVTDAGYVLIDGDEQRNVLDKLRNNPDFLHTDFR